MMPQDVLIRAVLLVRRDGPQFIRWASGLSRWKIGAGVLALVVVVGGVIMVTRGSGDDISASSTTIHTVELKSVGELSDQTSPLSIVGQVTSKSEATVRAEKSGQVTAVYKALGDTIAAGAVAAEIENASERATVLQAQAAYNAAIASRSSTSLVETTTQARNAYLSAYTTIDTVLQSYVDTFFGGPTAYGPEILISAPMYDYGELPRGRAALTDEMRAYQSALPNVGTTDPETLLASAVVVAEHTSTFLNKLAVAANDRESDATSDQLTALATARSTINALLSTLSTARDAYRADSIGATSLADASVQQAQGGLASARANLEKTIIRAPISGTINSFSLKRGDYVQVAQSVLTVANNSALEVVAYITENDAREIAVGQKASIDTASGVVTRIAPALDPLTKKIEVRIGVDNAKDLINGQSVLVSIVRTHVSTGDTSRITIPISAIKVESERVIVFTVDDNNMLVAHPVILGTLLGDRVVISSGVSTEMRIVVDARGLREGEIVEIK